MTHAAANQAQIITPAGKLRDILNRAHQHKDGEPVWQVWTDVLGIQSKLSHDVFAGLGKLKTVTDEIETQVQLHTPRRAHLSLKYLPEIREIISPRNIDAPWATYRPKVTSAVLDSLEAIEFDLGEFYPPVEFLNELPKIKNELAEIGNLVLSSSLPKELQDLILSRIESLCGELDDFQRYGTGDIREASQAIVGTLVAHQPAIKNEPQYKAWSERLGKVIFKIDQYIVVADRSFRLGGTLIKLLLSGGEGE